MAQGSGPCQPHGDPDGVPGSWLCLGPALALCCGHLGNKPTHRKINFSLSLFPPSCCLSKKSMPSKAALVHDPAVLPPRICTQETLGGVVTAAIHNSRTTASTRGPRGVHTAQSTRQPQREKGIPTSVTTRGNLEDMMSGETRQADTQAPTPTLTRAIRQEHGSYR